MVQAELENIDVTCTFVCLNFRQDSEEMSFEKVSHILLRVCRTFFPYIQILELWVEMCLVRVCSTSLCFSIDRCW